jgi:hypothetical protein
VVAISSKVTATEVGVVQALVVVLVLVVVVPEPGAVVVPPGEPLVSVLGQEVAVAVL